MSEQQKHIVLAVDPGRAKCGVAVVASEGGALARMVVATEGLWRVLRKLVAEHRVSVAVVGDRTGSERVWREVHNLCEARGLPVHRVDEHGSTQAGRLRYWQENPRKGWRRLFPPAWLTPPERFDDYVAVVLAERWLASPQEPEADERSAG